MELAYILIAAAILALPTLLSRVFSSGDTKVVMGAVAPPTVRSPKKRVRAVAVREQLHALVAQRRYAEAVKLVQSASGVPLKKAQEIVATLQRADAAQRKHT
jgi:hypothetical protein